MFGIQFVGDSRRLSPPPRPISPVDDAADLPPSAPAILQNERASSIATRLQERLRSGAVRTDYEALNQEKPPGTYFEAKSDPLVYTVTNLWFVEV